MFIKKIGIGISILYGLFSLQIAYSITQEDPNIIIYSTSHGLTEYTKTRDGEVKITVSSFLPITHIYINENSIDFIPDTLVTLAIPYHLDEESKSITITVATSAGEQQKTFTIWFLDKAKEKKNRFQLISILEISSLDNLTEASEEDDKVAVTKTTLTLAPRYDFPFGDDSTLRIKGIILRDKISNSDYSTEEISYTQLSSHWFEKRTFLGDLYASIGMNDIRNKNDNVLLGEEESEVELFFSTGLSVKIQKSLIWTAKLSLSNTDDLSDAEGGNYDADSTKTSLISGITFNFSSLKGYCNLGYEEEDAEGKYVDNSASSIALKFGYVFGDWLPSLYYMVENTTHKKNDPNEGVTPEKSSGTLLAKIDYKLFPGAKMTLAWKSKKQTSNADSMNFESNTTTLAVIYVF